ncbi:DUF1361 domain-containing protein [Paenibacillus aurantius]|uniref:DUF1361 domain-containing protein n=1 Tax=Paenibacillus aurantius TaxID=2918900 RepID=A0AA96LEL2_9BACL|nr:DUF1361 domain-containing protein [Paenibacillus aurantius]WNQ12639.1 DUF1361 domain-containing protein [Paenibacillus aurantius]
MENESRGAEEPVWRWLIVSAVMTLCAYCLILYRVETSGNRFYAFLTWNLFLAWLPFLFAIGLRHVRLSWKGAASRGLTIPLALLWLLFYPNASYVITDFIHFTYWKDGTSAWFDLLLLTLCAWNGLMLGHFSLYLLQDLVCRAKGAVTGWGFAVLGLLLGGIGVYVGRFLRWNSWDALLDPGKLLGDLSRIGTDDPVFFVSLFTLVTGTTYAVTYVLIGKPATPRSSG